MPIGGSFWKRARPSWMEGDAKRMIDYTYVARLFGVALKDTPITVKRTPAEVKVMNDITRIAAALERIADNLKDRG